MIKQTLEGLSILSPPPHLEGTFKAPVVYLEDGLTLDDSIWEAPTLVVGNVGSGKGTLLNKIMSPVLNHAEIQNENVIIFCAKKDFLKYKRTQELVISVDATAPKDCWNIFRELRASTNPELTARDISKSLTKDQWSELQLFFENAANNILFNSIMAMYEDEQKKRRHLFKLAF